MRESIHAKVIFRAAQTRGGALALARTLGVSLNEVQTWMRSEKPIPEAVLGEILDLIAEDALRQLESRGDPAPSY